jgi:hypothetical protein
MIVAIPPLQTVQSQVTALYLGAGVREELWFPVRKMIWDGEYYHTGCVGGVKGLIEAAPLWRHYFRSEDFGLIKTTRDIHCDYACRMPLDRPQEMPWYSPRLGLPDNLLDPIAFVARSGGYRETDSLDIFPEVTPDSNGDYQFYFLLRKLYLVEKTALNNVGVGDAIDCQDWSAIHQSTGHKIGILPGYIRSLAISHPDLIKIQVHQVNQDALLQERFLCSAICSGFIPFSTAEYLPLGNLK